MKTTTEKWREECSRGRGRFAPRGISVGERDIIPDGKNLTTPLLLLFVLTVQSINQEDILHTNRTKFQGLISSTKKSIFCYYYYNHYHQRRILQHPALE
jgi:hypothetical protein